eukprot:TRINITY_DN2726_c1_g1_i2.p1 TRINITY_DN2726_c1_g1~~TRINITY_DN2726_c1_g1_i2.p1  ORF type:complete len:731 (+),score=98.79 TRINITY_DN2726_c1_g1_i2:59-2251(+)
MKIVHYSCTVMMLCAMMLVAEGWTEQAVTTASNKAEGDYFGSSASMTDTYALIGAVHADPGSVPNAGAAYVFVRSGTEWDEQAILTASNKAADDQFGFCGCVTNNYALIGARLADPSSVNNAGAAYVFVRSETGWSEQAILTASNKAPNTEFGYSVSLTDNYALVGARYTSPDSISVAGAAYVFVRSGTTWSQQAYLTASNKVNDDYFGESVSLTNNYALVGAHGADVSPSRDAGAAYVFVRSGTTWSQQAILTASNKAQDDQFGISVALTDNYALIGLVSASRSYIFTRSGSMWTQHQILNAAADERRVALTENYAMIRNKIFTRSASTWTLQTTLGRSSVSCVALTDHYAIIGNQAASPGALGNAGEGYLFLNTDSKTIISASPLYSKYSGSTFTRTRTVLLQSQFTQTSSFKFSSRRFSSGLVQNSKSYFSFSQVSSKALSTPSFSSLSVSKVHTQKSLIFPSDSGSHTAQPSMSSHTSLQSSSFPSHEDPRTSHFQPTSSKSCNPSAPVSSVLSQSFTQHSHVGQSSNPVDSHTIGGFFSKSRSRSVSFSQSSSLSLKPVENSISAAHQSPPSSQSSKSLRAPTSLVHSHSLLTVSPTQPLTQSTQSPVVTDSATFSSSRVPFSSSAHTQSISRSLRTVQINSRSPTSGFHSQTFSDPFQRDGSESEATDAVVVPAVVGAVGGLAAITIAGVLFYKRKPPPRNMMEEMYAPYHEHIPRTKALDSYL